MTNNYKWNISSLDCYPEQSGQQNVVFKIYYYVEAFSSETHTVINVDGSASEIPYQASMPRITQVTYKLGDTFIPFNDLTKEQVINWINDDLTDAGIIKIIADLDEKIENQKNPQIVSPSLPWSN